MARARIYHSDAERQQAYRDRKKAGITVAVNERYNAILDARYLETMLTVASDLTNACTLIMMSKQKHEHLEQVLHILAQCIGTQRASTKR